MRWGFVVAVVASIAGAGGAARADAYDATLTRAIAAKERAIDVNEPARWEGALVCSRRPMPFAPRARRAMSWATPRNGSPAPDLAVEAYEAALDLGLTGQPRAKAQTFIGAHAASLGRLQIKGGRAASASAGLDRGRLPLRRPLVLFPGDTTIEVIDAGNRAARHRIKLTAAHLEILDLSIPSRVLVRAPAPSPPPAEPPSPTIVLTAPPVPHGASPPAARATIGSHHGPVANRPASGWWLLGGGLALAATGAVMVAVSHSRIDAERANLRGTCDVLDGTDACANAMSGLETRAQSDVDAIATWKAVRIGSWVGVGAGAVTAASASGRCSAAAGRTAPPPSPSPTGK